mgnify:CR=1 FL=1
MQEKNPVSKERLEAIQDRRKRKREYAVCQSEDDDKAMKDKWAEYVESKEKVAKIKDEEEYRVV